MTDLFQDASFAFSPDRPLFGPAGSDIDIVQGIGEHTGNRIATMGHRIGFQKSRPGFIPLIGFEGDLFSQEGTGFGRGTPSSWKRGRS
jgi:hypothetical protein